MEQTEIRKQIEATLQVLKALAGIIYEAGEIPSGHLYARLMGTVSLDEYQRLIGTLKGAGLVTEKPGHLLRWAGPTNLGTTPESNNNHN